MLNDEINAAREVTKQNAYRIETFGTRELGFLGYLDSDLKPDVLQGAGAQTHLSNRI